MKALKGSRSICTLSLALFWVTSACLQAQTNVLTYHNDNARTGQNTNETVLTPANVNSTHFGKLYSVNMDGYVFAQPLIVRNVSIPNKGTHNVAYVVTENDSLYAIDADNGSVLWQMSFINPSAGITTVPASDISCTQFAPYVGITSTPVIDPATGTIYLVAETKENGSYVQRLHAIDIAAHVEKFGGPKVIEATVSGTGTASQNGKVSFDPLHQIQRAALLLQNGHVIIGWGANTCDTDPFHGWVMSYNAATLSQEAVLCTTPNGDEGGVWLGGSGPAGDSKFIYFSTGNGDYDGRANFGDSILKISGPSSGSFLLGDWFTPYDQNTLRIYDHDLGSGGVLLLPDLPAGFAHQQLLVTASKVGKIYLVDRNQMGKYCSTCTSTDTQIVQEIPNELAGMWGMPAYWNGNVYFGGAQAFGTPDSLKAFSFNANNSGLLSTSPTSESPELFGHGPTPSVSANGNENGIVWGLDNASTCCHILHAYDATNLGNELYNSSQAPNNRDLTGSPVRFTVPTIANGKVYVGSKSTFAIFGLLPQVKLSASSITFSTPVALGQTTTALTATLTNLGPAFLSISSLSLSGANPSDFSETNTCGKSLAAGANCTISVTFHPTAIGTRTASVSIKDNGAGGPHTVTLKGTGTDVKLSATGMTFPTTTIGQSSVRTATLTNVGSTALSIGGISVGGTNPSDFGETNTCGTSVAAGASCTLTLTFHPTAIGSRKAVVSISDNGGGSPQTISLYGAGTSVKLSATGMTFPTTTIGQSSMRTATLTNAGSTALSIGSISVGGTNPSDFGQTNNCGTSLAAGASCTLTLTFHPTAIGSRKAIVSISDNGGGSPQTISVYGTGTYVKLSATGMTFPTTTVGQSSSRLVTLTNVGSASLTINGVSVGGTNPSDFSQTNNCGTSVAVGASCTFTLSFHPTAIGSRKAVVSISDNGGGSPQAISLYGTGQ